MATPIDPAKKGEINELKAALSNPALEKDQNKKRELLKKVIEYATMGYDTSKLYDTIILCVNTKDLVQKKMVYQYLTTFCNTNNELAILIVNTLSKDCRDDLSKIVRGLALRSLSQLKIQKADEHLIPLINEGLNDPSSYVRKVAVMAINKLYEVNPSIIQSQNFVERLYTMLKDNDISVVINTIITINDVEEKNGGLKMTKKLAYYLLKRIHEFNEWELILILKQLKKYAPKANQEALDIMNLLDDRLDLANSGVVLAICDLFLFLTENMPKIHAKVYQRLKDPLLLLFSGSHAELSYTILKHIRLMIQRVPEVFYPHYKDFFIRYGDPAFLKKEKLAVLRELSTEQNISDILEELRYNVSVLDNEDDQETCQYAIKCLGEIAVKIPPATETILSFLLDFMEMEIDHILGAVFIVLKDVLRKYGNEDFITTYLPPILTKYFRRLDPKVHVEPFVALVWILGEFGEPRIVKSAPYLLESLVNDIKFPEFHHLIKNEILSSSMKLFFKRPSEMKPILGHLFEITISDASHADVHDRALFYYRLLKSGVETAKLVVLGKNPIENGETTSNKKYFKSLYNLKAKTGPKTFRRLVVSEGFTEETSEESKDKIFSEFDSLSVPYQQPSEKFIISGPLVLGSGEEEEEEEEQIEAPRRQQQQSKEQGKEKQGEDEEEEEEEGEKQEASGEEGEEGEEASGEEAKKQDFYNMKKKSMAEKLLSFDEEEEEEQKPQTKQQKPILDKPEEEEEEEKQEEEEEEEEEQESNGLVPNPKTLVAKQFQDWWKTLTGKQQIVPRGPLSLERIEKKLAEIGIVCLASNIKKQPAMFYMYAQLDDPREYILLQMKVSEKEIEMNVKDENGDEETVDFFSALVEKYLKNN